MREEERKFTPAASLLRELSTLQVHPFRMAPEVTTEAELGSYARSGDVQALAALLERCRPSLYAAAVGLLGNRADALDAVQDTCITALVRITDLRDGAAARAWLHAVLRNVCLMRLRQRREIPSDSVDRSGTTVDPEEALDRHVMREWVWHALGTLPLDERLPVMLRYFSRCASYEAIARVTGAPTGTVRSRLNRGRSRLADVLMQTISDAASSHADVEAGLRDHWEDFYRTVHERPSPRVYRDLFVPDIDVRDRAGHWVGVESWSAHEREAIALGVRATVVDLLAGGDVTVLEIDFTNPPTWPHHCPPHATFVHRLDRGRTRQLRIHYPSESSCGPASPSVLAAQAQSMSV
jgi:RNA polymerase sigma factor (sigma-70 family)